MLDGYSVELKLHSKKTFLKNKATIIFCILSIVAFFVCSIWFLLDADLLIFWNSDNKIDLIPLLSLFFSAAIAFFLDAFFGG